MPPTPYAQVVTENIRDAVEQQSSILPASGTEISETPEAENPAVSIRYFENNADWVSFGEYRGQYSADHGEQGTGGVLRSGRLHDRLYVRILPGRESGTVHGAGNQRPTDPGIAGTFSTTR